MHVNSAVSAIPRSGIREIMDLAAAQPDTIRLEIGDPNFTTPAHIISAAHHAACAGATGYTPNVGMPALREALAAKVTYLNGYSVTPDQVVVTQGASQGIFAALAAVTQPGDEVLVPDPAWPNYIMMASLLRLSPARYALESENDYLPNLDELERLVTPATKVLLINSPSNPLGTVLSERMISALSHFAERHDLWLISDECYDEMVFDGAHVSPAVFAPQRTLAAYSLSKTYAMTGWRIGYLAVPSTISAHIAKCQETMLACVSAPSQHAALAALSGSQACVGEMREAYRRRRDLVASLADSAGIQMPLAAGAFYAWLNVEAAGLTSNQFARRLLREHRVAVAPGIAFGPSSDAYVRVSLATEDESLVEGVGRLATLLVEAARTPAVLSR